MKCTLQVFKDDSWIECAEVDFSSRLCRWNYAIMYALEHANTPISLKQKVDMDIRSDQLPLPAFLYDLVPQGGGRRFLLGELCIHDGPSADFPLICAGAFNPIGRLRVVEAVDFFEADLARHPEAAKSPGFTLENVVSHVPEFKEQMFLHGMLGTGTTGVQGAAPKYLLTKDRAGLLHGDAVLKDSEAMQHFIVKLPRGTSSADKKVLCNEAAYMRVAAAMGIRTHVELPTQYGDGEVLFVPRFDRIVRDGRVQRLHQESIASILGISGFDARPGLFEVIAGIRAVVADPARETLEFIKRDILNLAMRNTDNHARNTAVQVLDGRAQLTPLFDFAPMYLDPEMIPRALRWYHPETRIELSEWGDVLDALPVAGQERLFHRTALSRFADQIERLTDVMQKEGVDDDITEFLKHHIDNQVRQLKSL